MISFSIRVVVVRGETQRKPKVTTTLPEKVVSGPYYLTVPKCTDPCLSKQSAASPFIRFIHTFNSTAKTVNVFYVFATSHQWALEPNPRQYCFQQKPFFLTNIVEVSRGSINSRQIQNEALMAGREGPQCPAQYFSCKMTGKCHVKELCCQRNIPWGLCQASHQLYAKMSPVLRLLEMGQGACLRCSLTLKTFLYGQLRGQLLQGKGTSKCCTGHTRDIWSHKETATVRKGSFQATNVIFCSVQTAKSLAVNSNQFIHFIGKTIRNGIFHVIWGYVSFDTNF